MRVRIYYAHTHLRAVVLDGVVGERSASEGICVWRGGGLEAGSPSSSLLDPQSLESSPTSTTLISSKK